MGADIFTSSDTRCWHDGDALVLTLTSPRPTISRDVLNAFERAVSEAESRFAALVICSAAPHFAFGASLNDELNAAAEGRPQVLDAALENYQRVMLRLRHASVPTVAAVRGVAISGGCEVLMHCSRVVAHPESRIGLMEPLAGVVPSGGGLKELAYRASLSADPSRQIILAFETICAAIPLDPSHAQRAGLLTARDQVTATDPLADAIALGCKLQAAGYASPPTQPSFLTVGEKTLHILRAAQATLLAHGKLTAHQFEVNMRIALVLCGCHGDSSKAGGDAAAVRTEAELFALERQHFLALVQMPLTQARIEHLRRTGKPLLN
jgi:3-hydroxyacyl-CoA dehydrogenase